ncbi:MAG: ABC transporter substrate-binding protein [Oscillospiraceae bacterium]|nr:ABC transporter substrate-binding protein [Oscillospiraceae bacterium]
MKWKRLAVLGCVMLCVTYAACLFGKPVETEAEEKISYVSANTLDTSGFLHVASENMDTVDPQSTTEFYLVALNVFDRLVELHSDERGAAEIVPSLAESWEVSEDGLTYRFQLHEGVHFSNGEALTASDVRFTFERLLTYRKSVNAGLVMSILGARELHEGLADSLAGFRELDELSFEITLEKPHAAFIDCLSSPSASILDEQTLHRVGDLFGLYGPSTIGTGPFIVKKWTIGSEMILVANPDCWSGAPSCPGVHIRMMSDAESQQILFENGELDILDLDGLGGERESFLRSRSYQDNLCCGQRVGINYLTLNQSIAPLDDVRVRKALQYALDRQMLLDVVYNGLGHLENGIFPRGLEGHNPDLDPIPYDPALARSLLAEAGYADGFDLAIAVSEESKQAVHETVEIVAYMWEQIGVRATVQVMDADDYASERRAGRLACCAMGWTADYDDPENFIMPFFGSRENSLYRGLCYSDETVMERVRNAGSIVDNMQRIEEYRALEKKIVQEDAAWVPLLSRIHYFAVSDRVENFHVSWNGWSFGFYRGIHIQDGNG